MCNGTVAEDVICKASTSSIAARCQRCRVDRASAVSLRRTERSHDRDVRLTKWMPCGNAC
eukprot:2168806-Pyramimonas_sp.AAC.1